MPDLANCVRYDGKTYCWDSAAEKVVEIVITDVPFDKVPRDVLVAMLNSAAVSKSKGRENA